MGGNQVLRKSNRRRKQIYRTYVIICSMKTCTIYALLDPRTNTIKYVGRTVQPLEFRLRNHIRDAKIGKQHQRAIWIRELLDAETKPLIQKLEIVPNDLAHDAEREWTKRLLDEGHLLVNSNLAGGGCNHPKTRANWSPETRALLGQVADAVVAKLVGVTRKAVSYERAKLGIPASFDRTRNTPPPPMGGHNRIELPDSIINQLGMLADDKLAKIAGVSKKRIIRERHARGISSYAERTGNSGRYKTGNYPTRWLKR